MNNTSLYFMQSGLLLMMLLYCLVSYIVYQNRFYIYILVQAATLLLVYYVLDNQDLVEVFLFFFTFTYISAILYYYKHYSSLKLNYQAAQFAQILAGLGIFLYLVSYKYHLVPYFGIFVRFLIIVVLGIFFVNLSRIVDKIDAVLLGLLLCILALCFHSFMTLYNPSALFKKEWGDIVFKTISIFQVVFLMNALIKTMYSFNTEKEELEKKFFHQMQENFLSHLRVKQINEEINSNLHDDVGSQLSVIISLNQLALHWLDTDPIKTKNIINDLKETVITIPQKVENIIINNITDNNGKETVFFREMVAILFAPVQLKYNLNIINESMWNNINEVIQKHVFLIYKEILVNIIRHSKASFVEIEIEIQKNNIVLLIKDNGIGFDTTEKKKGYGLHSIRRRVERLQGTISIISAKNCGCSISISIDL